MGAVATDTALRDALRRVLTPPDEVPEPDVARPAAVLLPLVEDPEPWIVFTKRTEDLPRHPGEISFPGGMRAAGEQPRAVHAAEVFLNRSARPFAVT